MQIVDAASDCVRRAGFHGTSMAEIAQAAGLSVGQIYRYFENKEAIIAAIVARDVAEIHEKFAALVNSGAPFAETVITQCVLAVDRYYDPHRAALILEVLAEAARNPPVAAIVRRADAEERDLKRQILEQISPPDLSGGELAARGEVLSMLFEGMVVRGLSHPEGDRAEIRRVIGSLLRSLLMEPLRDPLAAPGDART